MQPSGLRFGIRDLMLATTLFAAWLTGSLYAAAMLKPGDLDKESGGLFVLLMAYLLVFEVCYRSFRRATAPYLFEFETAIPWLQLYVVAALVLLFSFVPTYPLEGTFFIASVPFATLLLLSIFHRRAYVNANGIFYLLILFRWSAIERLPSADQQLRLRVGPAWMRLAIDVPAAYRSRILELIATAAE